MTSADNRNRVSLRAEMRKFGLTVGCAFIVLFGLALPWIFGFSAPLWPFVLGAVLIGTALAAPAALAPIERIWMRAALKVGAFNSKVILGAVFFVVFTPVGVLRRLKYPAPLGTPEPSAATYRKPAQKRTAQSFERPF